MKRLALVDLSRTLHVYSPSSFIWQFLTISRRLKLSFTISYFPPPDNSWFKTKWKSIIKPLSNIKTVTALSEDWSIFSHTDLIPSPPCDLCLRVIDVTFKHCLVSLNSFHIFKQFHEVPFRLCRKRKPIISTSWTEIMYTILSKIQITCSIHFFVKMNIMHTKVWES